MNFNRFLQRKKWFLLPFSWFYGIGVTVHNKLFDWGWKKGYAPTLPLICVGNLSVGGTGKTPMVEHLLRILGPDYKSATISRGYKRATRGVLMANTTTTAADLGDEPMQFFTKFPGTTVVVGEKRVEAFRKLITTCPDVELVILDDAFQHRAIQAGLNILLTDYHNLFSKDYLLPAGQLRDLKSSYKRADIIVVTKCPPDLTEQDRDATILEIQPFHHQSVYFATLEYGAPYPVFDQKSLPLHASQHALLVTGIANPQPIAAQLLKHVAHLTVLEFPDHHNFNEKDIETLIKTFQKIESPEKIMVTTEKDAIRLQQFAAHFKGLPIVAIPVQHRILFEGQEAFDNTVKQFVASKLDKLPNFK